ncbi:TonB-dependent receptor [Flavobacteriaceae bacterium S0825]|uniref:carboxypeptidase-like regulatory domain-containing protein n=1 Tax=Gaetbulibacter sp. S0825 TaxID=2720084 RepID=UPI001430C673|nr:carboxypeptidase-like regulatory domain-containing protein [Gaetbulibacter sp. S0825]MCK0109063.1 TonB-dependent receptor [Flavobacteriaceae bacterium S0825]NIX64698.1 TonB-dependent receptor [Gaetbulibacter sp. S0825]
MRITKIVIVLIFCFQTVFSQEKTANISLSFEDAKIEEVIQSIENITNYKFFYISDWLGDNKVSGSYTNASINSVLADVFKSTSINFYIDASSNIILTQNNIIHDKLPDDFFVVKKENVTDEFENENASNPVFYVDEELVNNTDIVRIGKENRRSSLKSFVLTGNIKNETTGEPIANAAILVKENNTGTTTDSKGNYELTLGTGLNTLEVSALGKSKIEKIIIIYNNGELNFILNDDFESLDEVFIEANKDRNVVKAITGVSLIDVEEIKNIPLVLGERDILRVAIALPGITNAGEGASGYNVRGGKTDQNLILLDNSVVYNPSHFFGIFSALNPFTSKNASIYKGNIPAEFGGRLSSVFDIKTKEGNTKKFSGEASIGAVMSNLTLELPVVKEKSSLLIGGRSTYSNWILKALDDESLNNSKASFYDVVAKYHHKINKNNTVKTTAYMSKDDFSITSDSLYSYNNKLFSFDWEHKVNDKNDANIIVAKSQYEFNINYKDSTNSGFDLGYKIDETELKLKMKYNHSDAHKFTYGLSSKLYVVKPGNRDVIGADSRFVGVNIPKDRGLESAVFVSDNFTVNEKLLIDVGLRYSHYMSLGESTQRVYAEDQPKVEGTLIDNVYYKKNEVIKQYGGLEARISMRYFLMDDFSVKASFNNNIQYIHTLSNNTTVSPTDTWKLSDLNIKPQSVNQYSLGFYKNLKDNMYELSVEGYFKKSNNILDYKVGANLLLNETIEREVLQGEGKAYGIEFLIKKDKGKFNGWIGYTYSKSLNKFESEFLSENINNGKYFSSNYDKPHDLSLVTNYKITNRYSVSTNFVYQTGRPVTYPTGKYVLNNTEYVVYSERNKFRIPDYYRLDVSFNVEGNHKIKKFAHSFWNLSIYNVLGRNNPYSVFFVSDDGRVKAYKSSIFSIPIPTITYNFKF